VEWSSARTATHQYASPGPKTIRLEVKDTGGLIGDTTRTVAVSSGNTAPVAVFTVEPSLGTTSTAFEVDASGSTDGEDPAEVLEVRWDWTSDGIWDTEWSSAKTESHQYASPGTKRIRMEVRDTEGLTDDDARSVTVTWPGPPPEDMTLVPGGTFTMGDGFAYCGTSLHDVLLTRGFYLGVHEVTNREYRDALQWAHDQGYVTATSSSVHDELDGSAVLLLDLGEPNCQISFDGGTFTVDEGKEDYPIVAVSWYGAAAYCDWLSMRSGLARAYDHATWQCNGGDPYTAAGFRLPTDAEWEFAAQYDDERVFPWGNEPPDCGLANFWNGALCFGAASPVGSYPAAPAALGLYDMAGNVWEWCNDWHECDTGQASRIDPIGPPSGSARIIHGGSWGGNSDLLRASYRGVSLDPASTQYYNGFRCARTR
jgi:formylglycine-generating enzyme required for sulfatase activity